MTIVRPEKEDPSSPGSFGSQPGFRTHVPNGPIHSGKKKTSPSSQSASGSSIDAEQTAGVLPQQDSGDAPNLSSEEAKKNVSVEQGLQEKTPPINDSLDADSMDVDFPEQDFPEQDSPDSAWLDRLERYDEKIRQQHAEFDDEPTLDSDRAVAGGGDASDIEFSVGENSLVDVLRLLHASHQSHDGPDTSATTRPALRNDNASKVQISPDEIFRRHPIGEWIKRFRVKRLIGRGGFGRVYLASDEVLQRDVAIKVIPKMDLVSAADEVHRDANSESRAAAKLQHPNLVPLFEVAHDDDYQYLISEYCPGPTLAQYLRDQPDRELPEHWIVSIMTSLTSAIAYAHHMGLAHRDIKPGNILLVPNPAALETKLPFVPRLTDFGLVQDLSQNVDVESVDQLAGTLRYMPPEYFQPVQDFDARQGDIYSLGVVFYQLIAGRPPYDEKDPEELINAICQQNFPPPEFRRLRTSKDMQAICMKCLHGDPAKRYQSVDQLCHDLDRLRDGREVSVRRRPFTEILFTSAIGAPFVSLSISILLVALITSGWTLVTKNRELVVQNQRIANAAQMARRSRALSENAKREAVRSAQDAQRQRLVANRHQIAAEDAAYRGDVSHALYALGRKNFAAARESISAIEKYARPDQTRRLDFRLITAVSQADCQYRFLGDHRVEEFVFDPTSNQIGAVCDTGAIQFFDRDSIKLLSDYRPIENSRFHTAAISGDGSKIAIGYSCDRPHQKAGPTNSVVVIDRSTHQIVYQNEFFANTIGKVLLSGNANHLFVGPRYRSLSRIDLLDTTKRSHVGTNQRNEFVSITNDGDILAIDDNHRLCCWSPTGTKHWGIDFDKDITFAGFRASSNGRLLLTSCSRSYVVLHRVLGDQNECKKTILHGTGSPLNLVAVSPSGQYLAAASISGEITTWSLEDDFIDGDMASNDQVTQSIADSRIVRHSHSGLLRAIEIDDSGRVYSAADDQTLCFWSSRKRSALLPTTTTTRENIVSSTISNDGQLIFLGGRDGSVHVRRSGENKTTQLRPASGEEILSMQWSLDGRLLAVADSGGLLTVFNLVEGRDDIPSLSMTLTQKLADLAINEMQFDREGRKLAICQGRYLLEVVNIPSDEDFNADAKLSVQSSVHLQRSAFAIVWLNRDQILTCDDSIRRWNVGDPAEVELGDGCKEIQCAILDRPRNRILVGVGDGRMRVLDPDGQRIGVSESWLGGNPSNSQFRNIASIMLTPDGTNLITGSSTGEVGLWDAESLTYLGTLPIRVPETEVTSLRITDSQDLLWVHWSQTVDSRFNKLFDGSPVGQSLAIRIP